jgi:hypothetical protein
VHNRVKRWANILNWAFGILLSIATPATADVAFLFGNTPQGELGTHASGLPQIETLKWQFLNELIATPWRLEEERTRRVFGGSRQIRGAGPVDYGPPIAPS